MPTVTAPRNDMKRTLFIVTILASFLALGSRQALVTYTLTSESRMWIDGTSTLHDWTCDVTTLSGAIMLAEGKAGLEEGPDAAEVTVPVEGIECHKGKMNANLRKALKAKEYPEVRYVLDRAEAKPSGEAGAFLLETEGRLTVAGVEQPLSMQGAGEKLEDGRYRLSGNTTFSMKRFDVKPPSFMLGTIKTGEEVTVRFEVYAAASDSLETM